MSWSFRIGRLAGIDIFVHFTFLILLGWIGISRFLTTQDFVAAALGVGLTLAVFFIIVLHELGHALAARSYGIGTKDITLLPIGGVARLERMPEKPAQELVVALAGPAVNVALAAIFGGLSLALGIPLFGADLTSPIHLITLLFQINVGLILFNLLPAFPMDGGRVLRALLAMRTGRVRATQIAARIGQAMAIVFAIVGLLVPGYFMLLLVAIFVWFGAEAEAAAVRTQSGLAGVPVSAVMTREFATVAPDDTLNDAAMQLLHGFQHDLPVAVGERIVGLLSRRDVEYGMTEFGPNARVMRIMRKDFPVVSPGEPADNAIQALRSGASTVPVLYFGRLVGLITRDNVADFLWLRGMQRPPRERNGVQV